MLCDGKLWVGRAHGNLAQKNLQNKSTWNQDLVSYFLYTKTSGRQNSALHSYVHIFERNMYGPTGSNLN